MLSRKQIAAKISNVAKRQEAINAEIQTVLCEINGHVVQHGEVSLYSALLHAVKGVNRVAIHKWILDNGGARFLNDKWELNAAWLKDKRNGAKKPEECAEARKVYEQHIAENPLPLWFEEYKAEEDEEISKVWDAFSKVEDLIATIAKKSKSDKVQATHTDIERYLREAVEKYKADRALLETMAASAVEGE